MNDPNFTKSDIGAQAAWKGFSSQTLYIANRLLSDDCAYEYYPEDIEDLVNTGQLTWWEKKKAKMAEEEKANFVEAEVVEENQTENEEPTE